MESKTVEQQYKELKLVYIGSKAPVEISDSPSVREFPDSAKYLEAYLKDGWTIISFTSTQAYNYYTFLLGR